MEKVFRQVCSCEKCGNESEMVVTCTLEDAPAEKKSGPPVTEGKKERIKGSAVCSHCGNEADIWVDL